MPSQLIGNFTGLQGDNLRTFVDVLRYGSALAALTTASGGSVYPNLDFRDHKLPVVTRTARPSKYAEGATRTTTSSTTTTADMNVEVWEDWVPQSKEFMRSQEPPAIQRVVVDASLAMFPSTFDIEHLSPIAGGAGLLGTVEYDAADPIGSFSSLLAPYDETTYNQTGMVLTRAGSRKLGLATDGEARLQSPNGIQGLYTGPIAETGATGTDLGVATLMAIVGPFHAGAWGANGGLRSSMRPDATVDGLGPGTGHVQFLNEAAMGYANGIDTAATGVGFTILIDAV